MRGGLLAVGLALAAVGSAAFWGRGDGAPAGEAVPAEMLFTVRRGPLRVAITENGTLVAKDSQKVSSGSEGRGEISYLIDEGETVEEGEVLARLDTTALERTLEQLELDIVQAEANLNTAETELEIQQTENTATVEKAQFALTKATKELERYEQGDAPNDRRRLEVAVKQRETDYSRAKKRYEDSQELFAQEYISGSQLEQDQIDFERARVERDSAEVDLELFDAFTEPMTLAEKNNAVSDARRDLENAEKRALSTLRQKEVAVEQASKRLAKLQEQLTDTRDEIAKMTVVAPCPGIVLYGDPEEPWRRSEIKIGGSVWGRTTIFTIPDLRIMQVKLWIHEADINKLAEGQTAKITMDTYPGLVAEGAVTKIASIAGSPDPWDRDPDVKRFEVDVRITGATDVQLKPGISAKAEVFIEEKTDVLAVPLQCVFLEEGTHYCYVADDDGRPRRRAVTPGTSSQTHLEILAGLEPGERVLLYNPSLPAAAPTEDEGAPAPEAPPAAAASE